MNKKQEILGFIPQQGVLPLYFNKDAAISIAVLKALYQAGIRAVEYTNRGEAALKNFKSMRQVCDSELKGMYLGIGTIKNADTANAFVDAGADYLISPGLIEDVAKVADKNDMLWVPGCMTPSEIIAAENLGATFIKLFPGNLLGPSFMSTIKELFPGLLFMPTGGVELEEGNLKGWFNAGVVAVGMGSKLITKQIMEDQDYQKLTEDTLHALQLISQIRKK
ncbi:MAG: bifunctional 4-hydroxy-2-oxoglutarate aldolase/2-dehydro-3-deoxy-phosphogluconate aldolase [Bacteroidota bacterium]